jgi:hypothetical protein
MYEYPRLRLGVEAGVESFFGSNVKPSAIRESQSYYRYRYNDYYYDCGYLYNEPAFTRFYFGIKPEYSINHRLAVSTGVRFSYGENSLTSDREYFLWKVEETETSSNYISISCINQRIYNISVPVYLTIYTSRSDIFGRLYGKIGAVVNYTIASDVSVFFVNDAMNRYLPKVTGQFEKPSMICGHLVLAFGIKIGRMKHPFGSMEVQMPIYLGDNTRVGSLFTVDIPVGIGMQTTLYIPFGKEKLSYTYKR